MQTHFYFATVFNCVLIYTFFFHKKGDAAPIIGEKEENAMAYLSQYGWLDLASGSSSTDKLLSMEESIKEFQAFAGLNVTGELDAEIIHIMSLPRCGVPDKKIESRSDSRRRKRFVLQGSKWPVKDLTYRISKYPGEVERLGRRRVDKELADAFRMWEKAGDITFKRVEFGDVDIDILFGRGNHSNLKCENFDGLGKNLAHAFYPKYGGDTHFDDDEFWTIDSFRGTNLFQVAVHEFGHALGLRHSKDQDSVMVPWYGGYDPELKEGLYSDDVNAIQELYGMSINRRECDEEPDNNDVKGIARNCEDLLMTGVNTSGIYVVYPGNSRIGVEVYCDMETDGGGWTVILRRSESLACLKIDFDRDWYEYEDGFGLLDGSHFIGLNNMFQLTKSRKMELRIDLQDWDGEERFALYKNFQIRCPIDSYRLNVSDYSGNANDSFSYHNGLGFTTRDRDNDRNSGNCAMSYGGGWWYDNCYKSHLTGAYNVTTSKGVIWQGWRGNEYSLKKVEMKIRSRNFTTFLHAKISSDKTNYTVGTDVCITCNVTGNPKRIISFLKDNKPIDLTSKRVRYEPPNLIIQEAIVSDTGVYRCEANNSITSTSATISITIQEQLHPKCKDYPHFANCKLIVKAKYCTNKSYSRHCCESCTLAGQLPYQGPHLQAMS